VGSRPPERRIDEVLDLPQLFAVPWEGEGLVQVPFWARWVPAPRSFCFRSEIANLAGETWDVVDTTTYPNGRTERRRMRATPRFYDRVDLTEGGKALIDSIQMRLFGILVGRVTIRRTPTSA
jgi:hypothetical protein